MTACPCCSHPMTRHVRSHEVHWFCRHCWQDMPSDYQANHEALPIHRLIELEILKRQSALYKPQH